MSDLAAGYARLRRAWEADGGLALAARAVALGRLREAVRVHADDFVATLEEDFGGRVREETLVAEVAAVLRAVDHARPRLRRWAAPERIAVGFPFWPARASIRKQPRGVVGILGPANFPLQLTLLPLVGAIAAGCRVLVKPSELTPATAALIDILLREAFAPDEVAVVLGDATVAAAMTHLPLDHLLFTGSTANGRAVMAAAAATLTPVTLELGGKSPAVLAPDADVGRAARAIVAGKLVNAGQTCVAPDYVLVPHALRGGFVAAAQAAAGALYPAGVAAMTAVRGGAVARERLAALQKGLACLPLLDGACPPGRVRPMLVLDPPLNSPIMREEVFGPLLPVLGYGKDAEALAILNGLPRPLALYWFGRDRAGLDALLDRTLSGTVAVNETVLHAAVEPLPFGGVGASGMGSYHGRAGFDTFTHRRPVFVQTRFSLTRLLQPPYAARAQRIIRAMLR